MEKCTCVCFGGFQARLSEARIFLEDLAYRYPAWAGAEVSKIQHGYRKPVAYRIFFCDAEAMKCWSCEVRQRMSKWSMICQWNDMKESGHNWMNEPMNQWIDEPMNQWISQSMNQWSNEVMTRWTKQAVNEWIDESIISEPMNQQISESMNSWMNKWMKWTNGRTNEWMNE